MPDIDLDASKSLLLEIIDRADTIPVSMVLVPVPELRAILLALSRLQQPRLI
jgi:hypothetical protein